MLIRRQLIIGVLSLWIQTSKSKPLLEQASWVRALRQDLISGNIANVDTPFYKAKDIDFETMLIQKTREIYSKELKCH